MIEDWKGLTLPEFEPGLGVQHAGHNRRRGSSESARFSKLLFGVVERPFEERINPVICPATGFLGYSEEGNE
ncbi:MAG: hypothetical protein ABIJ42_03185 [Acidobacteriota bacterium]